MPNTPVNDELLSNRVRAAADALNLAIEQAEMNGLRVDLVTSGRVALRRIGDARDTMIGPAVSANVSRPL